jgi:hypothetical protein
MSAAESFYYKAERRQTLGRGEAGPKEHGEAALKKRVEQAFRACAKAADKDVGFSPCGISLHLSSTIYYEDGVYRESSPFSRSRRLLYRTAKAAPKSITPSGGTSKTKIARFNVRCACLGVAFALA